MSDYSYPLSVIAEGAATVQHWSLTEPETLIILTNVIIVISNVALVVVTMLAIKIEVRKLRKSINRNTQEIGALRRAVRALSLRMTLRRYRRKITRSSLANIVRSDNPLISKISVINPTTLTKIHHTKGGE